VSGWCASGGVVWLGWSCGSREEKERCAKIMIFAQRAEEEKTQHENPPTSNQHILLQQRRTWKLPNRIWITNNTKTMSTTNGDSGEVVPHCLICSEEGTDESGEPLRRDCSCRGSDSGFAHLSSSSSWQAF